MSGSPPRTSFCSLLERERERARKATVFFPEHNPSANDCGPESVFYTTNDRRHRQRASFKAVDVFMCNVKRPRCFWQAGWLVQPHPYLATLHNVGMFHPAESQTYYGLYMFQRGTRSRRSIGAGRAYRGNADHLLQCRDVFVSAPCTPGSPPVPGAFL